MKSEINKDRIKTLYETRFLKVYDLQYAENRHYYEVSRREAVDLVVKKPDNEVKAMLPDAVTIAVVLHLPGDQPRLLMSYEYRYPTGQFLLSPVAGLLDPEDKSSENPLVSAAISTSRKNSAPIHAPPMRSNTFGSVTNISAGPLFSAALSPPEKENTAGITISPAITAMAVSKISTCAVVCSMSTSRLV